jgi:hypothetical protein
MTKIFEEDQGKTGVFNAASGTADADLPGINVILKDFEKPLVFRPGPMPGKTAVLLARERAKALAAQMSDRNLEDSIMEFAGLQQKSRAAADEGLAAQRLGQVAAQACHDGLPEKMTPMKPLQINRGSSYIVMRF